MNDPILKLILKKSIIERLAEICQYNQLTLNTLLNEIIRSYLEDKYPQWPKNEERRRVKRKKVILPAMIFEKSPCDLIGRYHSATVLDISLRGIRFALPNEKSFRTEINTKDTEFEIFFSIDTKKTALNFRCSLVREEKNKDNIQVAAVFCETNNEGREYLQKHLLSG